MELRTIAKQALFFHRLIHWREPIAPRMSGRTGSGRKRPLVSPPSLALAPV